MIEWQMFGRFVLELLVLAVLSVVAGIVTDWMMRDTTDRRALNDAMWIIIDFCNSYTDCKRCPMYDKENKVCSFCNSPYMWRTRK